MKAYRFLIKKQDFEPNADPKNLAYINIFPEFGNRRARNFEISQFHTAYVDLGMEYSRCWK
jgi:hypothetical protein